MRSHFVEAGHGFDGGALWVGEGEAGGDSGGVGGREL
jgi:hypothetical protein